MYFDHYIVTSFHLARCGEMVQFSMTQGPDANGESDIKLVHSFIFLSTGDSESTPWSPLLIFFKSSYGSAWPYINIVSWFRSFISKHHIHVKCNCIGLLYIWKLECFPQYSVQFGFHITCCRVQVFCNEILHFSLCILNYRYWYLTSSLRERGGGERDFQN